MANKSVFEGYDYELDSLQERIGQWQAETFGGGRYDEVRNDGLVIHLGRELQELDYKRTSEEAADIAILLLGYAWNNGFSLWEAIVAKHAVNVGRKWGEPDAENVIEHVREDSDGSVR